MGMTNSGYFKAKRFAHHRGVFDPSNIMRSFSGFDSINTYWDGNFGKATPIRWVREQSWKRRKRYPTRFEDIQSRYPTQYKSFRFMVS